MNALYYKLIDTGPQRTDNTLVLIGGYTSDLNLWHPLIKEIKKENVSMHVLAIDNLGAGRSPQPKGLYTTREMAKDVCACMDQLGIERATILGHSMGSAIAQHIALHCPCRVGHLFLISSFARLDTVAVKFLEGRYELLAHGVDRELVAKACLASLFGNRYLENEENIRTGIQRVIENPQTAEGMRGQLHACKTHDTVKSVSGISCRTTIVLGGRDVLIHPEHSEFLHERIAGSKLVRLEEYGHMLPLECPRALCEQVLSSTYPAADMALTG